MVKIVSETLHRIDEVTLEEFEDFGLTIKKSNDKIISIKLFNLKNDNVGFTISSPYEGDLNIFVKLLKEFIEVRQL